jgi:hypothetical protein
MGRFELTEYLGLVLICAALAVTTAFHAADHRSPVSMPLPLE